MSEVGKQEDGSSAASVKAMALRALALQPPLVADRVADIGGGRGDFLKELAGRFERVTLLDAYPAAPEGNIETLACDLNATWPLLDAQLDYAIALEVIEHLENPRHFFRELYRVLRPGASAFVSTPNNTNFFARLLFLFRGEHRYFQDQAYPAHITMLLKKDLQRLAAEAGFLPPQFMYNHHDVVPLTRKNIFLPTRHFSNSIGILLTRPA